MLTVKINQAVSAKFLKTMKSLPDKGKKIAEVALRRCGDQLRNDAVKNAPVKTGNLRRSITMEQFGAKKVVVGTNLVYARILDQGGTIRAHTIYPRGKALRFFVKGKLVFTKKANIPARKVNPYKGRGYLTPAFKKLVDGDAGKIFGQELNKALNNVP